MTHRAACYTWLRIGLDLAGVKRTTKVPNVVAHIEAEV